MMSGNSKKTALKVDGWGLADEALVTIIISFRERWRFTVLVVESILRHTSGNFSLWVIDSGMPNEIRGALHPLVEDGTIEIIPMVGRDQPNDLRAKVIERVTSAYVVFVDNDVLVGAGWLDALIGCAEDTDAGIVCPLYLWGDSSKSNLIHMAGGDLSLEPGEGGLHMIEHHRHLMRNLPEVEDGLRREQCDFGEFHCLLMRRDVYSAEGIFDRGVATVHEHIHASLTAKTLGFETWFEPEAQVVLLAFAPWITGELSDFRHRWDFATAERSLKNFASRWGIKNGLPSQSPALNFVISHVARADLVDARPWLSKRRDQIMPVNALQQTFGGCVWLATSCEYSIDEIGILANAYTVALEHSDGLYRPCGRPFINHLLGTASVLLFYGCSMRHVLAGLLHALLEHNHIRSAGIVQRVNEQILRLGYLGEQAVTLVRQYSDRSTLLKQVEDMAQSADRLPLDVASLYLIEAANDLDMHLSFEVCTSGRSDILSGNRLKTCVELLEFVGIGGLGLSLSRAHEQSFGLPVIQFHGSEGRSFRFDQGRLIPVHQ